MVVASCLPFAEVFQLNFLIFVLRKKGSKTKERMKEEEIEKGDCGPPTRKVFFWFCRTWTKRYLITSQTRVKRVSRIHHRTILRGYLITSDHPQRMVRWCIRLTRLTLVCEVIRYRLVQVRQNQKKKKKKKKKINFLRHASCASHPCSDLAKVCQL